jgi:glyoxylase-like metal-dependent hydrolase (beta-lactamase superfamily II)
MTNSHRVSCVLRISRLLLLIALANVSLFAQIDLSGEWATNIQEDQQDRTNGPDLGDYTGLPLNDAARLRAESWDAAIISIPEWQCRPHPADYITHGPSTMRIWKEVSPLTRQVIAWHAEWLRSQDRPIYMDGRPHPSEDAAHTWMGFSTAQWQGDTLTITTTHLKEGYLRRNGVPRSDLATMTEHLIRHGNILEWVTIIDDPVYLNEPVIRTQEYILNPRQQLTPNPCSASDVGYELDRPKGFVPHHLPGANAFLDEFASKYHLPKEVAMGRPDSIYPEFRPGAPQPAQPEKYRLRPRADSKEMHVEHVRGSIYMLTGAGGNITVSVGPNGLFLVDAGRADLTPQVLDTLRKLSDKPIRFIVNTALDPDHSGGDEKLAKAGITITGGTVFSNATEAASLITHERVAVRMSAANASFLPTDTFVADGKRFSPSVQGEAIQIFYERAAHTDGDATVYFRGSDVIAAGDIFLTTGYPVIDIEKGGSYQGIINALNHVLDVAIPDAWMEGGTMIVPGHGRLADSADVAYYRDMLTIIRDRVESMIKKGMTLKQVQAERPTRDYDPRYGGNPAWTPDMFVAAVYQSLSMRPR